MLPPLHTLPSDEGSGNIQRLRELALESIIEATATARINRAMRSITQPPGEALNYKPGELADFHRPPKAKDTPAWHGPAEIISSTPSRGQVSIRWQNHGFTCRYQDIRRFIDSNALVHGVLNAGGPIETPCTLSPNSFTACPGNGTRLSAT